MKEIRAVILGLVVVIIVALALAFWKRPAPEFAPAFLTGDDND